MENRRRGEPPTLIKQENGLVPKPQTMTHRSQLQWEALPEQVAPNLRL